MRRASGLNLVGHIVNRRHRLRRIRAFAAEERRLPQHPRPVRGCLRLGLEQGWILEAYHCHESHPTETRGMPVLSPLTGTIPEMMKRSMAALTGFVVTAALVLTACGSTPSTSPNELQETLSKAKSWEVAAVWTWAADSNTPTRMTGRGTWEDAGTRRTWLNEWQGTSTLAVITEDQVLLEDGTVLSPATEEGQQRVAGDLFAAADPLSMAAAHGVILRGDQAHLSGRGNCSSEGKKCLMRLGVELDSYGHPMKVTLVVTRVSGTDKITYQYTNVVA
jgi:hypothetical protein